MWSFIPAHQTLHLNLNNPSLSVKVFPHRVNFLLLKSKTIGGFHGNALTDRRHSHDVPVELGLLHLLHHPHQAPFEVSLKANVVLEDQRFVQLHVHHLRDGDESTTHTHTHILYRNRTLHKQNTSSQRWSNPRVLVRISTVKLHSENTLHKKYASTQES